MDFRQAGRWARVTAPMIIKDAMKGTTSLTYLERCLVTHKTGRIDVPDEVALHKIAGACKTRQAADAMPRVIFRYTRPTWTHSGDTRGLPCKRARATEETQRH